jgi:hypothetical protein
MVWHIFRKDLKLLWHVVAGVVALYILRLVIVSGTAEATRLSALVAAVCFLAVALLVIVVVQKDAIPGLRQDWLVRPIRRTDLLLSKLLFVVVVILAPMFVGDFCKGLAIGFPAGLALSSSFAETLWMLLVFALPLLAFATLTRNLMETLVGAMAVALAVSLFLTTVIANTELINSTLWWITGSIEAAITLIGAGVILWLQYYGRKTVPSRWICGVTILVALASQLLPWKPAFALQEELSPQPSAAAGVQIELLKGTVVSDQGLLAHMDIGLNITGVRADETLVDDRVDSRIIEKDGTIHPLGRTRFDGHSLSYDDRFQVVTVPRDILKSETAQLQFDYYLTLFRMTAHEYLHMNNERLMGGLGVCATTPDFAAANVSMGCRFGRTPTLTRWSVTGMSYPTAVTDSDWLESYSPWPRGGLTSHRIFFRIYGKGGPLSSTTRQEAGEELRNARIEMRAYEPVAHFTRQVTGPVSKIAP